MNNCCQLNLPKELKINRRHVFRDAIDVIGLLLSYNFSKATLLCSGMHELLYE